MRQQQILPGDLVEPALLAHGHQLIPLLPEKWIIVEDALSAPAERLCCPAAHDRVPPANESWYHLLPPEEAAPIVLLLQRSEAVFSL